MSEHWRKVGGWYSTTGTHTGVLADIINTDVQTLLAQPVTDTSKFQSTTRSMQSLFGQVSEALAPMTTRMILGDLSSLDPADVETGVPASEVGA